MSPELAAVIDAARDLAWRPHGNCKGGIAYYDRREAHDRLVSTLADVGYLSSASPPELRLLVEAMRRVAACTFSNRYGLPYAERRQAMFELRGCIVVWDEAQRVAA